MGIWVYAHRRDSEFHLVAAEKVRELAAGRAPWALPWPCLHEFFSIVTHPRIAALCLTHGVRALWTADRDFSRFPRLRTVNPLV
jgi:predicted nucleic acid-binding protein